MTITESRQRLVELHRSGQLAAAYPEVAPLLGMLSASGQRAVAPLLARLDPDDVIAHHPDVPVVRVAVTGHGTLADLIPALTVETARHGLLLRPSTGDFDGWVHDLSDPDRPVYAGGADLVLCVLDPMVVFDEVPITWTTADVERILAEKTALLDTLVSRFTAAHSATLVLNTLPLPRHLSAQLIEHRARARLGAAWREANAGLLRLADRYPSVVVVDLDPLLASGLHATDVRLSLYANCHLSAELLAAYACEVGHLARHIKGRTRKVLALDLDGTVWGGVLGEDGPEGIEVSGGYRGQAFSAFQRAVKQIGAQGVLIVAVSKNDFEPVRNVLAEHPDMVLREEDFALVTANWRPKTGNLRETAKALNLGLDSIVFLDDSAYECDLVASELPEVVTVRLDAEPAGHLTRLLAEGWFDVLELTADDRARPTRHREESARVSFLQSFDSIEDYLRKLGVEVTLAQVAERDIARVSQLTLRTNQFNLTTVRLQPAEVTALAAAPDSAVLSIRSRDRFGDNGLVGAIFLRTQGDTLLLDNFLLSCRVFSRGIETACLAALLEAARATGAREVRAQYRPTPKNSGVKDFYPRHGFARISGASDVFRHDLAAPSAVPEHVRLSADLIDHLGKERRERHQRLRGPAA
jgi:FkbH-like protein